MATNEKSEEFVNIKFIISIENTFRLNQEYKIFP